MSGTISWFHHLEDHARCKRHLSSVGNGNQCTVSTVTDLNVLVSNLNLPPFSANQAAPSYTYLDISKMSLRDHRSGLYL